MDVSKHFHNKAGSSLKIFKSSFWKLLCKPKAYSQELHRVPSFLDHTGHSGMRDKTSVSLHLPLGLSFGQCPFRLPECLSAEGLGSVRGREDEALAPEQLTG